jgi:hypothetical protein
LLDTYIVGTDRAALLIGRPHQPLATAPAADRHGAGGVTQVEIVREGPGVDDVGAGLGAHDAARPNHELHQTVFVDARRRADHEARQEHDADDGAHPEAKGNDTDGRERPGVGQRARSVEQVGHTQTFTAIARPEFSRCCVWVPHWRLAAASYSVRNATVGSMLSARSVGPLHGE